MSAAILGKTRNGPYVCQNSSNPLAQLDLTYGPQAPPACVYAPPRAAVVRRTSISMFCTATARPCAPRARPLSISGSAIKVKGGRVPLAFGSFHSDVKFPF